MINGTAKVSIDGSQVVSPIKYFVGDNLEYVCYSIVGFEGITLWDYRSGAVEAIFNLTNSGDKSAFHGFFNSMCYFVISHDENGTEIALFDSPGANPKDTLYELFVLVKQGDDFPEKDYKFSALRLYDGWVSFVGLYPIGKVGGV